MQDLLMVNRKPELVESSPCSKCRSEYQEKSLSFKTLPTILILTLNLFNGVAKVNCKLKICPTVLVDDQVYRLYGVVVHSGYGRKNEGDHYYSYVKIGGSWNCFDDQTVTIGAQPELKGNETATILFYLKWHGIEVNDEMPEGDHVLIDLGHLTVHDEMPEGGHVLIDLGLLTDEMQAGDHEDFFSYRIGGDTNMEFEDGDNSGDEEEVIPLNLSINNFYIIILLLIAVREAVPGVFLGLEKAERCIVL